MTVRVLVVDDDFRVAEVHAAALARLRSCEVVGRATTLADARARLAAEPVDLVLADEYLPDGSGTDLIGASDASVMMVTAADAPETVRRALARGAVGYIVKPFDMPVLLERVAAYARYVDAAAALTAPGQLEIDALAAQLRPKPVKHLPKRRSAVTADAVTRLLKDAEASLTAAAVAEALGVSRATAQRYLSDLVADGSVSLSLRYGSTGRPEHRYTWGP